MKLGWWISISTRIGFDHANSEPVMNSIAPIAAAAGRSRGQMGHASLLGTVPSENTTVFFDSGMLVKDQIGDLECWRAPAPDFGNHYHRLSALRWAFATEKGGSHNSPC